MANKNSNYPSNQLNNLPDGVCADTVECLRELAEKGKPETAAELQQRIDDYFKFCGERDFRPGIESLCLCIGVTRQTLWNWCRGDGCNSEWMEICQNAKQFILTFLEQISLCGRLNPASSIFYLKNWGSYSDTVTIEDIKPQQRSLTVDQLPKLGDWRKEE